MTKTGILLHVYHLEADDWEKLVWGDSEKDELGTGTKFVELLLNVPFDTPIESVIFSGPSQKNNLNEGGFTKQFLVERSSRFAEFPRLKRKLDALSRSESQQFLQRLESLYVGPVIKNTTAEVAQGAAYFKEKNVTNVVQIAAPSHAPRCMKAQIMAKQRGDIDNDQQWLMIASDICFSGSTMDDVVVVEPPHRGDDAMKDFQPTFSQVIKPYFSLTPEKKKAAIQKIHKTLLELTRHR